MYIAILGRQPAIGVGELEALYGSDAVEWPLDQAAVVSASQFSLERLGGTKKAGYTIANLPGGDWRRASTKIVQLYTKKWQQFEGKLTLGISAYGFTADARDVQKTGIILKQKLRQSGVSLRLVPNTEPALTTATSHHNKLGLSQNKVELIVVRFRNGTIAIAESIGTQNITAYALRDQKRPKRDAFVGMLPPKLAQIMINLASIVPDNLPSSGRSVGQSDKQQRRLLDPFCGTGVILQEAALMGYRVYGTDLSDKMIAYSQDNLAWLASSHHLTVHSTLHQGDAMTARWQSPIHSVACESYLGQPFSAPPSPAKLSEVRRNCNHIIRSFLQNIGSQLPSGTPLCVAIPAWRGTDGSFTHLPLLQELPLLGYHRRSFTLIQPNDLLYYREDQVVGRELLSLIKT